MSWEMVEVWFISECQMVTQEILGVFSQVFHERLSDNNVIIYDLAACCRMLPTLDHHI